MPFILIISPAGWITRINGQLERLVIGARSSAKGNDDQAFELCQLNSALSTPRSDSGVARITPASAAAVRGANFAIAKFRDAYGSRLEAIVGRSRYRGG